MDLSGMVAPPSSLSRVPDLVIAVKLTTCFLVAGHMVSARVLFVFMLGTDGTNEWLRLNAVCPYYTMFPLDFPLRQMESYPDAKRVLDPFCGRGTTLYAARLAQRQAVGIDISPVAVAVAQAKTVRVKPEAVVRLARQILRELPAEAGPAGEFWEWAFHPDTLREVVALRSWLLSCANTSAAKLLRALVLGALHGPRNKGLPSYLSNQMPRTYASKPEYAIRYWQRNNLFPVRVDTMDVIRRKAHRLLDTCPPALPAQVIRGDAAETVRRLRQRFELVITSPPYYGMRTYVQDQWLRNWFVGGPPDVPYGSRGQLAHQPGQDAFIAALSDVWSAVSGKCAPGAKLVIRFGALPSSKASPEHLVVASLNDAKAGWLVRDVRPAGVPKRRTRQAEQFGGDRSKIGQSVNEIDVLAELMATRR